MEPILLPVNQLHRFYRGGERIAALRSSGSEDPYAPEEWIASMASPFGEPGAGLSTLPDGRLLRDAVACDPTVYLGEEHADRFGADVAVLIKLLDAGERLPVHMHPDDEFARAHLDSIYGKTEAWIILEASEGAAVQVGFKEDIDRETVAEWVSRQDADALLASLRTMEVSAGDTLYVPAGTPHAIGDGILLAELQQPTDFSILLEWERFAADDPAAAHLGLGFDTALKALDLSPWSDETVAWSTSRRIDDERSGVERLFPREADVFFRAERIHSGPTTLDPCFSVLLVVEGAASLSGDGWKLDASRGDAVLVPYAAGEVGLDGDAEILRCMAPHPQDAG
jgi:mannose-6-phosphate isomerase